MTPSPEAAYGYWARVGNGEDEDGNPRFEGVFVFERPPNWTFGLIWTPRLSLACAPALPTPNGYIRTDENHSFEMP